MTNYEDISWHLADGVARIAVNRPDKLNACRDQTADELRDALSRAENEPSARAVLLTGKGRGFGAGYDLPEVDLQNPALEAVLDEHFNPLIHAMRSSRLPIVSAVNGPCAGASVGIALAADIVIANRSAFFYEPFVGIALLPDAGNTLFLPRILGRIRAAGMMLLAERIPAERALEWGLLWDVTDDDKLESKAFDICNRLAGFDPEAIADTKQLIGQASDFALGEQLDAERDRQVEAGRRPAMKERIEAFVAGSSSKKQ